MNHVSVIVPVHNGQDFVERCWQSVVAQTRFPRELLFVDDGSTDGTLQAIAALKSSPFRVRVLSQPQRGPAAARNLGICNTEGSLLAFLDIDDRWPSYMLNSAEQRFCEHPQAMVVQGLVQLEYSGDCQPSDERLLQPHHRPNLGSYVFRRQVFELIGLLDESLTFAEDLDFIGRLRHHQLAVHLVNEVFLYYLRHQGGMTQGQDERGLGMFEAAHKALQRKRQSRSR